MSQQALQLLRERLHKQEQQALQRVTRAREQLLALEQRQATVEEYRRQYLAQFNQAKCLSVVRIQHLATFIGKLDAALAEQGAAVSRGRQNVDVLHGQWAELRQRLEAIELLLRQRAEQAKRQAQRREQDALDEFSNARFCRKTLEARGGN